MTRNRICAAILGGVFLLSTGFRILDPSPYFAIGRVIHFGITMDAVLVAIAATECFAAVSLIRVAGNGLPAGRGVKGCSLALLLVYTGFLCWLLLLGRPFECSCLGPLRFPPWLGLLRNLLLIGLALGLSSDRIPSELQKGPDSWLNWLLVAGVIVRLGYSSWRTWAWVRNQGMERPLTIVQVEPNCGACAKLCLWLMGHPDLLAKTYIITPSPLPIASIPAEVWDRGSWRLGPATPTMLRMHRGRVTGSMIGLPTQDGKVNALAIQAFIQCDH